MIPNFLTRILYFLTWFSVDHWLMYHCLFL